MKRISSKVTFFNKRILPLAGIAALGIVFGTRFSNPGSSTILNILGLLGGVAALGLLYSTVADLQDVFIDETNIRFGREKTFSLNQITSIYDSTSSRMGTLSIVLEQAQGVKTYRFVPASNFDVEPFKALIEKRQSGN